MTEDLIGKEISSIIDFIEETRKRVNSDYDKFQVALSNTLRLLEDTNTTITRLKGDTEDLKGYLVKTSTEMRKTALLPYDQIRTKLGKILDSLSTK